MPWAGLTSLLPSAGLIVMPVDGVCVGVGLPLVVLLVPPVPLVPLPEPPAADVEAWQAAASIPAAQTTATVSSGLRLDDLPVPSTLPSSCLGSTRRLPRPFPSMPDQADLLGQPSAGPPSTPSRCPCAGPGPAGGPGRPLRGSRGLVR